MSSLLGSLASSAGSATSSAGSGLSGMGSSALSGLKIARAISSEQEQKRREEIERQRKLNAMYGLMQEGLQLMNQNNNPYAWRAY